MKKWFLIITLVMIALFGKAYQSPFQSLTVDATGAVVNTNVNITFTNKIFGTFNGNVVTQSTAVLNFNFPETILTNNITYTSIQGVPSNGVRSVMANVIGTNVIVSWPTEWTPNNTNTVYLTNGYVGFRVVAIQSLATNVMAVPYQP